MFRGLSALAPILVFGRRPTDEERRRLRKEIQQDVVMAFSQPYFKISSDTAAALAVNREQLARLPALSGKRTSLDFRTKLSRCNEIQFRML